VFLVSFSTLITLPLVNFDYLLLSFGLRLTTKYDMYNRMLTYRAHKSLGYQLSLYTWIELDAVYVWSYFESATFISSYPEDVCEFNTGLHIARLEYCSFLLSVLDRGYM